MTATERQDLAIIGAVYYDDLIGPGEIRELAGAAKNRGPVSSRTLWLWRQQDGFPQPIREVSGVAVWDRRHVVAWLKERGT